MLFSALWCFVVHPSLYQPRKRTKKHRKAPKSTDSEGGGASAIVTHANLNQPPKSTKTHGFEGGEEVRHAPKNTEVQGV